jgi:hypothetical protein
MKKRIQQKCERLSVEDLKADVEEAREGQRFVHKVFAFFVLEIVCDPEVLKELEEFHRKEK